MKQEEVLSMFLARRDNYNVSSVRLLCGHIYEVTMNGKDYKAVILASSFQYYEKRYHLAQTQPGLVICYEHDTVLPIKVLSMRAGNLAEPYELPQEITDLERQRRGKLGSQVLLGMYISGMKVAQTIVNALPNTSRKRYLAKAKALAKRKVGRPVGLPPTSPAATVAS